MLHEGSCVWFSFVCLSDLGGGVLVKMSHCPHPGAIAKSAILRHNNGLSLRRWFTLLVYSAGFFRTKDSEVLC